MKDDVVAQNWSYHQALSSIQSRIDTLSAQRQNLTAAYEQIKNNYIDFILKNREEIARRLSL